MRPAASFSRRHHIASLKLVAVKPWSLFRLLSSFGRIVFASASYCIVKISSSKTIVIVSLIIIVWSNCFCVGIISHRQYAANKVDDHTAVGRLYRPALFEVSSLLVSSPSPSTSPSLSIHRIDGNVIGSTLSRYRYHNHHHHQHHHHHHHHHYDYYLCIKSTPQGRHR